MFSPIKVTLKNKDVIYITLFYTQLPLPINSYLISKLLVSCVQHMQYKKIKRMKLDKYMYNIVLYITDFAP